MLHIVKNFQITFLYQLSTNYFYITYTKKFSQNNKSRIYLILVAYQLNIYLLSAQLFFVLNKRKIIVPFLWVCFISCTVN